MKEFSDKKQTNRWFESGEYILYWRGKKISRSSKRKIFCSENKQNKIPKPELFRAQPFAVSDRNRPKPKTNNDVIVLRVGRRPPVSRKRSAVSCGLRAVPDRLSRFLVFPQRRGAAPIRGRVPQPHHLAAVALRHRAGDFVLPVHHGVHPLLLA